MIFLKSIFVKSFFQLNNGSTDVWSTELTSTTAVGPVTEKQYFGRKCFFSKAKPISFSETFLLIACQRKTVWMLGIHANTCQLLTSQNILPRYRYRMISGFHSKGGWTETTIQNFKRIHFYLNCKFRTIHIISSVTFFPCHFSETSSGLIHLMEAIIFSFQWIHIELGSRDVIWATCANENMVPFRK